METFLRQPLWWRANAQNVIIENLNGDQFNYIIISVDNAKLPCYTLPPTQHHGIFRKLPPYPFNPIFSLLLLFKKQFDIFIFQNFFFDPWSDLWSSLWSDLWSSLWSDLIWCSPILVLSMLLWFPHSGQPLSHNYFCMYFWFDSCTYS